MALEKVPGPASSSESDLSLAPLSLGLSDFGRVAAVSQLLQRREKEQAQREQRREQKATDELAARLMASAPAGPLSAKNNLPPTR